MLLFCLSLEHEARQARLNSGQRSSEPMTPRSACSGTPGELAGLLKPGEQLLVQQHEFRSHGQARKRFSYRRYVVNDVLDLYSLRLAICAAVLELMPL